MPKTIAGPSGPRNEEPQAQPVSGWRSGAAIGCRIISGIVLAAVLCVCIPATVPQAFGYEIFSVVSGSMEPEVPVGSLVYVKPAEPAALEAGDVIAFSDSGAGDTVITHRVVENRTAMGELVTKGDANDANDAVPVKYGQVIGRMEHRIPALGGILESMMSRSGSMAGVLLVAMAIMLQIMAAAISPKRRQKA